ncbi:peroxide stress protein YaaA [Catenovulum sp. 2E275]|uniref:peroxide stress protein YaaA n=1 Tax=Catenovulum sp. 2E275 TaxID=2980497 RepID=UPI0021CE6B3D|nr:peroxide stress protein YaaA [Catenovulum sp. 2E275]MCU4674856.1 peroxide stress protein YaaA [Catenovulum sp. 2E275]
MLVVISPAKNLDYETSAPTKQYTQPELLEQSQELVKVCKQLTPADLSSLMKISDKLAGLNAARFADWQPDFNLDNAKQALFAFNGDVYTGLNATELTKSQIDYAQQHLRILSGLYGVLKPLDLMMAYRLEMGTKLKNERGDNLYQFWGEIITQKLNQQLSEIQTDYLVNLASNEYFKSVKPKALNATLITPEFKDWKNGQYKIISFYAKKARGLMARYIIENKVKKQADLLKFDLGGYQYAPDLSKADKPVFTRRLED